MTSKTAARTLLEPGSQRQQDVFLALINSFLDENYMIGNDWKVLTVEEFFNEEFYTNYLKTKKLHEKVDIVHGYVPVGFEALVDVISNEGKSPITDLNHTLGDVRKGVNLGLHADVCLKWANQRKYENVWIVVYKVIKGRTLKVPARTSEGCEYIDPMPEFDNHCCERPPSMSDPLEQQVNSSQIFLYEFGDDREPVNTLPSHCFPWAILSFTRPNAAEVIENTRQFQMSPLKSPQAARDHNSCLLPESNNLNQDEIAKKTLPCTDDLSKMSGTGRWDRKLKDDSDPRMRSHAKNYGPMASSSGVGQSSSNRNQSNGIVTLSERWGQRKPHSTRFPDRGSQKVSPFTRAEKVPARREGSNASNQMMEENPSVCTETEEQNQYKKASFKAETSEKIVTERNDCKLRRDGVAVHEKGFQAMESLTCTKETSHETESASHAGCREVEKVTDTQKTKLEKLNRDILENQRKLARVMSQRSNKSQNSLSCARTDEISTKMSTSLSTDVDSRKSCPKIDGPSLDAGAKNISGNEVRLGPAVGKEVPINIRDPRLRRRRDKNMGGTGCEVEYKSYRNQDPKRYSDGSNAQSDPKFGNYCERYAGGSGNNPGRYRHDNWNRRHGNHEKIVLQGKESSEYYDQDDSLVFHVEEMLYGSNGSMEEVLPFLETTGSPGVDRQYPESSKSTSPVDPWLSEHVLAGIMGCLQQMGKVGMGHQSQDSAPVLREKLRSPDFSPEETPGSGDAPETCPFTQEDVLQLYQDTIPRDSDISSHSSTDSAMSEQTNELTIVKLKSQLAHATSEAMASAIKDAISVLSNMTELGPKPDCVQPKKIPQHGSGSRDPRLQKRDRKVSSVEDVKPVHVRKKVNFHGKPLFEDISPMKTPVIPLECGDVEKLRDPRLKTYRKKKKSLTKEIKSTNNRHADSKKCGGQSDENKCQKMSEPAHEKSDHKVEDVKHSKDLDKPKQGSSFGEDGKTDCEFDRKKKESEDKKLTKPGASTEKDHPIISENSLDSSEAHGGTPAVGKEKKSGKDVDKIKKKLAAAGNIATTATRPVYCTQDKPSHVKKNKDGPKATRQDVGTVGMEDAHAPMEKFIDMGYRQLVEHIDIKHLELVRDQLLETLMKESELLGEVVPGTSALDKELDSIDLQLKILNDIERRRDKRVQGEHLVSSLVDYAASSSSCSINNSSSPHRDACDDIGTSGGKGIDPATDGEDAKDYRHKKEMSAHQTDQENDSSAGKVGRGSMTENGDIQQPDCTTQHNVTPNLTETISAEEVDTCGKEESFGDPGTPCRDERSNSYHDAGIILDAHDKAECELTQGDAESGDSQKRTPTKTDATGKGKEIATKGKVTPKKKGDVEGKCQTSQKQNTGGKTLKRTPAKARVKSKMKGDKHGREKTVSETRKAEHQGVTKEPPDNKAKRRHLSSELASKKRKQSSKGTRLTSKITKTSHSKSCSKAATTKDGDETCAGRKRKAVSPTERMRDVERDKNGFKKASGRGEKHEKRSKRVSEMQEKKEKDVPQSYRMHESFSPHHARKDLFSSYLPFSEQQKKKANWSSSESVYSNDSHCHRSSGSRGSSGEKGRSRYRKQYSFRERFQRFYHMSSRSSSPDDWYLLKKRLKYMDDGGRDKRPARRKDHVYKESGVSNNSFGHRKTTRETASGLGEECAQTCSKWYTRNIDFPMEDSCRSSGYQETRQGDRSQYRGGLQYKAGRKRRYNVDKRDTWSDYSSDSSYYSRQL